MLRLMGRDEDGEAIAQQDIKEEIEKGKMN